MGLFNQFVSAAVKQVGRDAGKIISKKVYANSGTSIAGVVNENGQYDSSKEVYSYNFQGLDEGDFVYSGTQYFKLLFGHWLWLIIFAPIPFLGITGSLIFAYKTFITKHFQIETPLFWKTIRIKDNRKKEGFREMTILTPDNSKKRTYQLEIPKANRIYSILSLTISALTTAIIILIRTNAK